MKENKKTVAWEHLPVEDNVPKDLVFFRQNKNLCHFFFNLLKLGLRWSCSVQLWCYCNMTAPSQVSYMDVFLHLRMLIVRRGGMNKMIENRYLFCIAAVLRLIGWVKLDSGVWDRSRRADSVCGSRRRWKAASEIRKGSGSRWPLPMGNSNLWEGDIHQGTPDREDKSEDLPFCCLHGRMLNQFGRKLL